MSFLDDLGTAQPDYIGDYSQTPLLLGNPRKPKRPGFLDTFQAGVQQNPRSNPILAGLSGQAGAGGFLGGLGNVAKFLL